MASPLRWKKKGEYWFDEHQNLPKAMDETWNSKFQVQSQWRTALKMWFAPKYHHHVGQQWYFIIFGIAFPCVLHPHGCSILLLTHLILFADNIVHKPEIGEWEANIYNACGRKRYQNQCFSKRKINSAQKEQTKCLISIDECECRFMCVLINSIWWPIHCWHIK